MVRRPFGVGGAGSCLGRGGGVLVGGGAHRVVEMRGRWALSVCSGDELVDVVLGRLPSRESVRM
jgi:hypothetical protein